MRSAPVEPARARPLSRHRLWLIIGVVVVLLVITSLRGIAVFYTDFLWFQSQGLTKVWIGVLGAKVGLTVFFVVVFFVLSWGNLSIVDRLAPRSLALGPEDELVSRYREVVFPKAWIVRTVTSVVLAVLVGAGASSEWNNWILYRNSVSFHMVDPQFHHDISLYVFKLPFLSFLVNWTLAALAVVTVAVAVDSYLTGGIRVQGRAPHVAPYVKAHLSVLLGAIALVKALGYVIQRYQLLDATDGYAQGAFYTDVHVRQRAFTLLIYISLFAFVILLVNIRRRGWVLPIIAVGLWAFISLVVGAIIPALVQRLEVQPSQLSREEPYIARNIVATRYASDINGITTEPFSFSQDITALELERDAKALSEVRIWDPEVALPTVNKLQDIRSYYNFNDLSVNRLSINGVTQPVVIGVRELNSSQLPASSWVNTHLQYTHGYGAVIAPANTTTSAGGPNFVVSEVPPQSTSGAPQITQPQVYYGLNEPGYVVADTKQTELDFQTLEGATVGSHYAGKGGVAAGSVLRRAAFALRFGDLNVLLSGQITSQSRVLYIRSVAAMVQKAAPFLTLDSSPYPVLLSGQIYWLQDAYTTTDRFPYAEDPQTQALSSSSGLSNINFNYIRNSVKVLINAYDGKMTFYITDPSDPIIKVYQKAFPGLFTPASQMPTDLTQQLRYPIDLFTVQANAYGRYHITDPAYFYNAGDAWTLSPDPGTGSPSASLSSLSMPPQYSELQLPGQHTTGFDLLQAMVPVSNGSQQNLTAFLVAGSDPDDYGQITSYVTPRGDQVDGPALVNSKINANATVAQEISYLDQHGSQVIEGTVMVVPVDQSLIYVRPLYVSSSQNLLPEVQYVVVVYGTTVTMAPTLAEALDHTFGSSLSGKTSTGSHTSPPVFTGGTSGKVATLIDKADSDLMAAQADLTAGNLGGYQSEVNKATKLLNQAAAESASSSGSGSTTTTTSGNGKGST